MKLSAITLITLLCTGMPFDLVLGMPNPPGTGAVARPTAFDRWWKATRAVTAGNRMKPARTQALAPGHAASLQAVKSASSGAGQSQANTRPPKETEVHPPGGSSGRPAAPEHMDLPVSSGTASTSKGVTPPPPTRPEAKPDDNAGAGGGKKGDADRAKDEKDVDGKKKSWVRRHPALAIGGGLVGAGVGVYALDKAFGYDPNVDRSKSGPADAEPSTTTSITTTTTTTSQEVDGVPGLRTELVSFGGGGDDTPDPMEPVTGRRTGGRFAEYQSF